jgi:flagellar basal body-associated protein FliL
MVHPSYHLPSLSHLMVLIVLLSLTMLRAAWFVSDKHMAARRDIQAGEPILMDYATCETCTNLSSHHL